MARVRSFCSGGSAVTGPDARCAQEERVKLSSYGGSMAFDSFFEQINTHEGSAGIRRGPCDESSAEVDPVQDPRRFYASDSPVFNNSDSDQEMYRSAEETFEPEDQGGGRVVSSVGLHVSFAWPVSSSTDNP